ncbi:substrate-binding domain-containing protein [Humisphaera borealis]|uniref:Autoinducer 2 import system permease protein LsrD n=2 Tax=Humisphaera borealis TaxID=2807512 RepID=A0A7M2X410_9BACT|nr:substrate-binding domain-containing protein [Humisphaera borealis]
MTVFASQPQTLPGDTRPDFSPAPQQVVLVLVLLFEVGIFGLLGENFLSLENLLTVLRQNADLGLIALALTPIILTGGIDLSVGSLMGLSAVVLGKLHDAGVPLWLAVPAVVLMATLCGAFNGLLITRGKMPPLIVTLGTFALFRGVAEGLTRGQGSFGGFPEGFVDLGQGTTLGLPTQLWIFLPAAVLFYLLVHRSTAGRALSAIGYSADGARHAGIRVDRLTLSMYALAGFCAGLASIIYVARFGEARANAASGFELQAITAVVLGGTSIFGGRASIIGTLLGLLAIAFLENGQTLASASRELTGILVGVLLLSAAGLDYLQKRRGAGVTPAAAATAAPQKGTSEDLDMRNSQLAVLCAVIVAAALIIAGGNYMLVNAIKGDLHNARASGGPGNGGTGKKLTIAMMPKTKGNAYFIACQKGAEEAAKELGIDLIWDGPASNNADPAAQNTLVETWITRKVDVIAVAVENQTGLSTALRKAQEAGIKVVTWDADADANARSFFCNQATPDGIGDTLMDLAAKTMNNEGEFVIISGSQTAANLNLWRDRILLRVKDYPKITCAEVVYCDDNQNIATDLGKRMINKYPNLKLILGNCSPAVPGGAEAVKQSARPGVKVIGVSLPNENKKYVHEGVTAAVVLWKTADLGYLTVHAAKATAEGTLKPGATSFTAGRLGELRIDGTSIILGKPFIFTKDNIDQFDF